MDKLAELKDKLQTTVKILQWELCDMWGHASAKTPDGRRFLLAFLRPPADPSTPNDELLEFDMTASFCPAGAAFPTRSISIYVLIKIAKTSVPLFIAILRWRFRSSLPAGKSFRSTSTLRISAREYPYLPGSTARCGRMAIGRSS